MSASSNQNNNNSLSPTPQNRRLQVEKDLDKIRALMSQKPKNYEKLIDWKMEAENWIAKMDEWLSDFQVMSSAYLKPRLMSTYEKLTIMFDGMEQKEEEWQNQVGLMYHHQLPKHGVQLTTEQFDKLLYSDFNNPSYCLDADEDKKPSET